MRHRRASTALLALGLLLPLGACGDDDDGGAIVADDDDGGGSTEETLAGGEDEGGAAAASISIEDFAFSDASVAAGATVEVDNGDGTTHTVTSDDGAWDEVRLDGGAGGSFTAPDEAGSYAFHCAIHPNMTGTLTVE